MAYGDGGSGKIRLPVAPKCPECGRDMEYCIAGPPSFDTYYLCRYCGVRVDS